VQGGSCTNAGAKSCVCLRRRAARSLPSGATSEKVSVLGLTNGFANVVGRDLVLQARRDLPAVELSVIEERSVVLVEAIREARDRYCSGLRGARTPGAITRAAAGGRDAVRDRARCAFPRPPLGETGLVREPAAPAARSNSLSSRAIRW
jgi:hypothetical protein